MITKEIISGLVSGVMDENMFLVDVAVGADNEIVVEIDSFPGLTIDQCVAVSRHIESNLDRNLEDYSLKVSSPGLGQPFKVIQQYRKQVGREIELTTGENGRITGMLSRVDETGVELKVKVKEKTDAGKKPAQVTKTLSVPFEDIRKAKVVISFK